DITDHNILLFGKIISCWDAGPASHNCRFIKLSYSGEAYNDFHIKMYRSSAEAHGLAGDKLGRILIAYGRVRENGIGLSIDYPAWGEISLLPDEYDKYLYE